MFKAPLCDVTAMLTGLLDALCRAVMLAIMILTATMVASMGAQVFWRYVLNDSLIWPEEVSRYAFIWTSCLGMSVGVRRGDLIAIDVLWGAKTKRVRLLISLAARALIIPMLLVFVWEGWALVDIVTGQRAAATNIPVWWIYLALPVSSVLALLFIFETIARDIRELSALKDHPE
jgi:TRAP-type C4-dicarboxylate transport system permease small subunit